MTVKIVLSFCALLFSMAAISQDSTATAHKSTHVHVKTSGTAAKRVLKHKRHYRTRRHTTYHRPANSRTTKITTTTTTHTDKK